MGHGKIPNVIRRFWIHWCVFWYRQQQREIRKAESQSRARWAAAPAFWDQCQDDLAALECLIADLEQENL